MNIISYSFLARDWGWKKVISMSILIHIYIEIEMNPDANEKSCMLLKTGPLSVLTSFTLISTFIKDVDQMLCKRGEAKQFNTTRPL